MAIQTVSIAGLEDIYQYDDTEAYDDAVTHVGIRAVRALISTAPFAANDVVRLADLGSLFAPHDAQYVTLVANANLTNERVLTAGTNITIVDSGAGAAVTISSNEYWQSPVIDKDLIAPPI